MNAIMIHIAEQDHLKDLHAIAAGMKKAKTFDYFETGLQRQKEGHSNTLIIRIDDQAVGYCLLNWVPKYGLYRKLGIPEIQDLNILPRFRRQGLATLLIEHCENMARQKKITQIGISFGLDASYGAAQNLYIRLGYIPDGYGVTYDRISVATGDIRPIDDDLCLMLVKDLATTAA